MLRRVDAEHVVVEGVEPGEENQRPMKGVSGGIVDKDLPIHVSNGAVQPGDQEGRPHRR